ncbi:tRNA1(Val) (adenine(37)-N6)-methyltransferase [Ancylobacter oerskovii]|uniref:tRNA1(Val) (Adenine(37)-N6)-methyltransferase n=1 Tax=Ancylobacter oerskovii TaxID=459519 RepID=A0ABW4YUW9_9HYPH|nr:methyltransferase [Ancylobacter oerskovii]MBS7544554.1 methyltransferase [Ancylobacter oerskovii]
MSAEGAIPDEVPLTDDALLGGRLHLLQPARGHRAGHDALLLAAMVPAVARHVVDLGAGVGAAGLAVAVRLPAARLHLVELDPPTASLARRNAARQQPDLAARVAVVQADIATLARSGGPVEPAPRAADAVLMNPPFNDPACHRISPNDRRALAHMAPDATLDGWVRSAERLLAPGGHLALIHRPEALSAILAALDRRFGAVTIRPVHGRPQAPAIRVLVGAVKGRRTPPSLLPGLLLADSEGRPTQEAEAVLREGAPLA